MATVRQSLSDRHAAVPINSWTRASSAGPEGGTAAGSVAQAAKEPSSKASSGTGSRQVANLYGRLRRADAND